MTTTMQMAQVKEPPPVGNLAELYPFEMEILEILPGAPGGLSVNEIAEEVCGDHSRASTAQVHKSLKTLQNFVALDIIRGNDDFGRCGIKMYAINRTAMPAVRDFFGSIATDS